MVCGHHGIGSLMDFLIGDWLALLPLQYSKQLKEIDMADKKTVWVAYAKINCKEVPIFVCEMEVTARRLASEHSSRFGGLFVRPADLIMVDGKWYVAIEAVALQCPNGGDIQAQAKLDAKHLAIANVKAAGLTDKDLGALGLKL
jgi:hypothetical protein